MSTKVSAKTKGYIKRLDNGEILKFQFNPTELDYSRSVSYTDITAPGMHYPGTQFVRGNIRTFTTELFLYERPAKGTIKKSIGWIGNLLTQESNNWGSSIYKPPDFLFCQGYFIRRCVLESLDIKIELFDEDGEPVQARLTLGLRQVSP